MNRTASKVLKIVLWVITSIIMLVILAAISLNIPAVQNIVKNKVISYLKQKTGTEISLEKIRISFPTGLRLDKFYIADKKNDTLLYAGKLAVQLDMIGLIKSKIAVSDIELQKVYANVYRTNPDTSFNYQFLVDAFVSADKEPEPVKKDSSAPLKLELDKILLDDINLKFKDDVTGNDAGVFIDKLNAKVDKVDLEQMHYVLNKLELNNARLHYFQNKPLTVLQQKVDEAIDKTEQEAGGKLPTIEVHNFNFSDVDLKYDDRLSDTKAFAFLKKFVFRDLVIDLTNGKYQTSDGELSNSIIDFAYHPTTSNEQAIQTATDSIKSSPFSLYINNIVLANNIVKYDDLSAPHVKGMDFNHLNIKGLSIGAKDIAIDSAGIKAIINEGKLADTSGFVINDLKGKVLYDDKKIIVEDLLLKTPNTYINNNSQITYSSVDDLTKHPEKVEVSLIFNNSVLGLADAYYFAPSLPSDYHNQRLNLEAIVRGSLNNVDIKKLQLQGMQSTNVDVAGNIKGLPNMEKALFNINIGKFATSKSDINALLPKGTLPKDIELPNHISASGKFVGSLSHFNTNLNIKTDMGSAKLKGAMGGSTKNPTYKANVDLSNFNVGRLLKRNDIGAVSLVMNVAGSGTSTKTIDATANGTIYSANYNKYNYQNIKIDGSYAREMLHLQTSSSDTNANFDLNANVNMEGKYPSLKGTVDLKKVDLQKLNFTTDQFQLGGLATLDFPTLDPDYLNGTAYVSSLQVATNGKIINVDTIALNALATPTENRIQFVSDIMNADLYGQYQLTQLGQAFINEINKYYAFAPTKKIAPQKFNFNIVVHESKLLKEFVPAIGAFAKSTITGGINTEADSLVIAANFPHIYYDSFDIKNITLNISNRTDSFSLNYTVNVKSIESPSISLYNSTINGVAANNLLGVNVHLRDSKDKDKYMLGGNFKAQNETYQFSLDPEKLLLNYDKWQVAPDNLIQYGKAGIYVRNFNINNSGQSLSINSTSASVNSPINVRFNNFMLETVTRYAEQDTSLVGGTLNGTVDVKNVQTSPEFEANLTVDHLRYKKDELGDVKIVADNYTKDAYKVDLVLSGVHDVQANGYYYTKEDGMLDMTININRFDLKYIESLSGGQVKDGSGILTGKLSAQGALTSPKVLGNLTFKEAAMNIAKLNSLFKLKDETISFQDNAISFNNFTLLDSANQAFTLNGKIKTADYKDFGFDLKLRANNFRALNSTSADNELFYGKVYVTLDANIGGDMNKPEVKGTVNINKDTRFFFVIPDDDPTIVNQEGIVEFIDMDAPPNNGRAAVNVDSLTRSPLKGLNLSMDLQTDKEAEITVIVDPANGDALLVKGEAELNLSMDPSGKISMTGRYKISDGSYNLSIGGFAKRKFKLLPDSYINWTGSPTEANVDLTAVYNVNTSALDLIASEAQSADESTKTMYRQKLPFIVYLKMTDQLLKPTINFEITLPENEKNAFGGIVNARLMQVNSNESELNKQVFALLALNRFISENPFESLSSGTSPEMLARQSVSRLLTQQLNNLAASLIKGVDVSFDLTSQNDFSTGNQETRTDLEVNLSKRLFHDRLTVTIGSDFALEGASSKGRNSTNIAGNVNIEYMLSRDGRYRLRAYRRNQSDLVVEGQIIETGLGFIMVVDYNKLSEIFRSFKSEKRLEREREERHKKRAEAEAAAQTNN